MVPEVYDKIHQEADEVLNSLKKVTDEIQELLGKRSKLSVTKNKNSYNFNIFLLRLLKYFTHCKEELTLMRII